MGSDGEIKIADFGVSHFFEQEEKTDDAATEKEIQEVGQLTKTEGTYYFFAPEMCTKGPFNAYACDVWALGICVWAMVFGTLPFKGGNPVELFDLIQNQGEWRMPFCNPARSYDSLRSGQSAATRVANSIPPSSHTCFFASQTYNFPRTCRLSSRISSTRSWRRTPLSGYHWMMHRSTCGS